MFVERKLGSGIFLSFYKIYKKELFKNIRVKLLVLLFLQFFLVFFNWIIILIEVILIVDFRLF